MDGGQPLGLWPQAGGGSEAAATAATAASPWYLSLRRCTCQIALLPQAVSLAAATAAAAAAAATATAADVPEAGAEAAAGPTEGQFSVQYELPQGRLVVRPLQADDVGAASVVLTRAFATSLQGIPIQDGRKYCVDCLAQAPRGVLLVARLDPTGAPSICCRACSMC